MRLYIFLCLTILASCSTQRQQNSLDRLHNIEDIQRIAFGSCNVQEMNQAYWDTIAMQKPDLWIWMGDNIYGDSEDMNVLKQKYDKQKADKYYKNFIANTPILGTWDDHDYGVNDGNKLFKFKNESKALMIEFLDLEDLPNIEERPGVYYSVDIGQNNDVKVISLDTRSFQDVLKYNPTKETRYLPSDGDLLGEDQWKWLEKEIQNSESKLNIIVSSIQFIAVDHKFEKWANFPKSRDRMLELLSQNRDKKVIFISGDRHLAEVSRMDLRSLQYPLYDITSSGLTHSYEKADEPNRYRISKLSGQKNFAVLELSPADKSYRVYLYETNGQLIESIDLEGL